MVQTWKIVTPENTAIEVEIHFIKINYDNDVLKVNILLFFSELEKPKCIRKGSNKVNGDRKIHLIHLRQSLHTHFI